MKVLFFAVISIIVYAIHICFSTVIDMRKKEDPTKNR